MASRFQERLPFLFLVLLIFLLDRWTKSIIHSSFDLHESISIIDGFFNITYVQNTGVAFGIFSSVSSPVKSLMLSAFTAAAATIVIVYSLRSPARDRLVQGALSLILGGALGNLYDRVRFGYVVDFLEFHVRGYYWPTFNVADSAISTGVVVLALGILRNETPGRA